MQAVAADRDTQSLARSKPRHFIMRLRRAADGITPPLKRGVSRNAMRGDLPDFDLEAEVTYVATAEGGRRTPARSGYRPTCDFGVPGVLNDGAHFFVGKTWVAPGETVFTKIQLISPEPLKGRLHVAQSFEVREGTKLTARAVILRLHNESLAKPSD